MGRFAAVWVLGLLLLAGAVACREPAPPAPRIASVPVPADTAVEPVDAGPAPDAAPSDWQARCTEALAESRPAAAAFAADLANAFLDHQLGPDGREEVSMIAHAPYHKVAPTYVVVERGSTEPAEPDAPWRIVHAESRDGRYFVTHARTAGRLSARVTLDGWEPRAAERLAPVLITAADHCFD